ncbi:MAG: hypothetical protein SXA11_15525 [Cyanobacteriota bacterium]|nr:hypothetical protein [Cyanobacteriota bacterium]
MANEEIKKGYITRYCKPSSLNNGIPDSSAFRRRNGEKYVSVHLLEFFQKQTELENVIEVKKYMTEKSGFKCRPNGSFAVLDLEQSKEYILEQISAEISCKEKNLPHCGIFHEADDFLIAELLAECVLNNYLVKNLDDSNIPPPSPS